MRLRFWLKLIVVLLTGVFLYQAAICSSQIQDLVFGCRILAAEKLGTAVQRDRWIDESARAAAARSGTIEDAETIIAFRDAVESQRRLASKDQRLAAYALEIALSERDEAQSK
jgi:hypothetical protein